MRWILSGLCVAAARVIAQQDPRLATLIFVVALAVAAFGWLRRSDRRIAELDKSEADL